MNLIDSMKILGLDPDTYFIVLEQVSRADRVKIAKDMIIRAKAHCRNLLALHHPDKGGNPLKFKMVNEAHSSFLMQTEEFIRKIEAKIEETRDINDSRILITTK